MHVAEGFVERGQLDHVSGGVEALDVASRADPAHSRAEPELPGQLLIRARIALTRYDEPAALVAATCDSLQQRAQPLALEAGADEEDHPGVAEQSEVFAHGSTEALAGARMEALEVHAVVDQAHALGRRGEEALDLGLAHAGDRDDLACRPEAEDPPLERAHEPVVRAHRGPPPSHRREIGSMRPLARAIEVLPEPALVA